MSGPYGREGGSGWSPNIKVYSHLCSGCPRSHSKIKLIFETKLNCSFINVVNLILT